MSYYVNIMSQFLQIRSCRKSKVTEWEHTQTSFAKDEEQARKRLTAPVTQRNGRRKSLPAESVEAQLPNSVGLKSEWTGIDPCR